MQLLPAAKGGGGKIRVHRSERSGRLPAIQDGAGGGVSRSEAGGGVRPGRDRAGAAE